MNRRIALKKLCAVIAAILMAPVISTSKQRRPPFKRIAVWKYNRWFWHDRSVANSIDASFLNASIKLVR